MGKKLFVVLSILQLSVLVFTGCAPAAAPQEPAEEAAQPAEEEAAPPAEEAAAGGGEVYFLNFKAEVSEI